MSSSFSKSPFSLLFFFFFAFSLSLTVRSDYADSSIIRLPVDDAGALCAGTAPPPSCPVKCFRTDPVCGVDGVTYWCGCADALCSGTRVAKLGFVKLGMEEVVRSLVRHSCWFTSCGSYFLASLSCSDFSDLISFTV
ncbi:hypothetical protein CsSME_00002127 [Camellia sinensis var. sinensis]